MGWRGQWFRSGVPPLSPFTYNTHSMPHTSCHTHIPCHTSCNIHVFYAPCIHHSSPKTYMYSTAVYTPYHMLFTCHMASCQHNMCAHHSTHASHTFNHTHSLNMYYTSHGLPSQTHTNTLPSDTIHAFPSHKTHITCTPFTPHKTHSSHQYSLISHTHPTHNTLYCCWLLGSVSPLEAEAKWCHGGLRASRGKCGFKGVGVRDKAHSHLLRSTPWSAHAEESPHPLLP